MLKVLPNELPQDPDIEKVKKEEYVFKTDGKDAAAATPVESNEIDAVLPTDSTSKTTTSAGEPFMEIISSVDSSNEIDDNPPSPTEGVQIMIIERKDLEKTVTQQAPEELLLPALTGADNELRAKEEAVTVFSTNAIDDRHDKENLLNLSNGGILEGSIFQTFHFDEKETDENETDEDYSTELVKPPRPTEYTSKQRTMPSSTLLHGNLTLETFASVPET